MKILLHLSYCGTDFHGSQIQPNKRTVAGELEKASSLIFGCGVKVSGCSRTDAGVHALDYYAAAELYGQYNRIPLEKLTLIYNNMLPHDISMLEAYPTSDEFNPRKCAAYKTYEYIINDSGIKDPFSSGRVLNVKMPLDDMLMDKCAKDLIGEHDFSAFCAVGGSAKTTIRTITDAHVRREGKNVIFSITGNGFLYNMVRIVTGTLIYISQKKLTPDAIKHATSSGDRTDAGYTVPGDGLYLARVTLDKRYTAVNYDE